MHIPGGIPGISRNRHSLTPNLEGIRIPLESGDSWPPRNPCRRAFAPYLCMIQPAGVQGQEPTSVTSGEHRRIQSDAFACKTRAINTVKQLHQTRFFRDPHRKIDCKDIFRFGLTARRQSLDTLGQCYYRASA